MEATNETEQKQFPDWVEELVAEAYARGVMDGREEMRSAIKATINCVRLLPAEKVKAKAA